MLEVFNKDELINGGYITMLMIRDYPQYFAAAFPPCAALRDDLITDSDIQKMKEVTIWFTAAKNDGIVPLDEYVVPTCKQLLAAEAKNVQFSFLMMYMIVRDFIRKKTKRCLDTMDTGLGYTLIDWLATQHK